MTKIIFGNHLMPFFFALTLFVSSGLLFLVQPMAGKMVLPLLGGTPAVWNGCMVFFQAGLLAGYGYSHGGPSWLGLRRHALLHVGLILLPLLILPMDIAPDQEPLPGSIPILWLWSVLTLHLGLPFILVASTGPLLQRWFASAGHSRSGDPYFLYAASNLGSMLGLLSYPFLMEPNLDLDQQSWWWTVGYGVLVILTMGAAAFLWRSVGWVESSEPTLPAGWVPKTPPTLKMPTLGLRARWVALSLVPSSLLLSVTLYITTDLAAIPLLWVLPLGLYLFSYILVFTRWQPTLHGPLVRIMPMAVLVLAVVYLTEAAEPILLVVGLHLAGFFVIALVCHGELARTRPPAQYLTEFYLWLAFGGVLGGLVNYLAAPLLFNRLAEYPLGLLAACFLRPGVFEGQFADLAKLRPWRDPFLLAVGGLTVVLVAVGRWVIELPPGPLSVGFMFGLPLLLCYTAYEKPLRFALGMTWIFLISLLYPGVHGEPDYRVRSFFGVHRVTHDNHYRYLVHGNTVHGQQSFVWGEEDEPRTYYHRQGPIGKMFKALKGDDRFDRVGVIGLGTGALACYAEKNQYWTFFEIDPAVIRIARDPALFTYLENCKGKIDVEPGDARLSLKNPRNEKFGFIVVDAFTSDAIPVHLLTREAMNLYKDRLRPDGLLAFHISNRYIDLQPILANLAADGDRPMICLSRADQEPKNEDGKWPSHWMVLTFDPRDQAKLRWLTIAPDPRLPVWTDRFSNLFQVLGRGDE